MTKTFSRLYLPAAKFLSAVSSEIIETAMPAGRAILMVDFRTSSPATLSSMTMTRVAPDTGAHCVTMMP